MANICDNRLTVRGQAPDMEALYQQLGGALLLRRFRPVPDDLIPPGTPAGRMPVAYNPAVAAAWSAAKRRRIKQAHGVTDWYAWCTSKWGTTTDLDGGLFYDEKYRTVRQVRWFFETAWAPPEEWVKFMGKVFHKLTFELYYAGVEDSYAGRLTVKGRKVVSYAPQTDRRIAWLRSRVFGTSEA